MVAGTPLPHAYTSPDVDLVKAGCSNLVRHIHNTCKYGVPVVVAINQFASDSPGMCVWWWLWWLGEGGGWLVRGLMKQGCWGQRHAARRVHST